jgi:hypothetical protein
VKQEPDRPTPSAPDNASRLSGIPRVPHDDDERPSREDVNYGQTIFTRPVVPLPRWLSGGKRKKRS